MVVAVIGANGFIGSHLTMELLRTGHIVHAVYNRSTGNIPPGSIPCTLSELYDTNITFDMVYLVMGNFSNDKTAFINQAVEINKITNSLNCKKIIHISSIAVYGTHHEKIQVNSSYNQPSPYGMSRLTNEFIVSGHPDHTNVRLTYIYGAGMGNNSLIPRWIEQARREKQINVLGNGSRVQDYLHIDDAVDLCIKSGLVDKANILIGATGVSVSNLHLAHLISNEVEGCKVVTSGTDNAPSFTYDISHTKSVVDWEPLVTIEQGIKNLMAYESSRV